MILTTAGEKVKIISSTANTVTIKKDEFLKVLSLNDELRGDIRLTAEKITELLKVIGLVDKKTGKFKGDKSMRGVIREIPSIIAGLMIGGGDLEEKFAFLKELAPLLEKYQPENSSTTNEQ